MEKICNKIKFTKPADLNKWEEYCLPIGNGYMGASFFGGVARERVVLNEKTLWTGGPSPSRPDYNGGNRKGAYEHVDRVRRLLYVGAYDEALAELPYLTCESDDGYGAYQLLCDAVLEFPNVDPEKASDYYRELDLDRSLYRCSFAHNGERHVREAFASYPDRVICMRFSCGRPSVCLRLSLDKIQSGGAVFAEGNTLNYFGALADNGLRYGGTFYVKNRGGSLRAENGAIFVENALEVSIFFAAATDYADVYPSYRSGTDPRYVTENIINACRKYDFERLYERHFEDYSALFDRVELRLGNAAGDIPPIDSLLPEYRGAYSEETAARLEPLYFQFGRYMLISSSRRGSLPANLQGVWNESNEPPWCCDYHINVNLQMNYWCAHTANLSETAAPLIRYLERMREPGRITAAEYYGIRSSAECPESGWIAHTQATPFGWTAPGRDFFWGWSTAAVAWLMQNLWECYEFTLDKELLAGEIYPIMRESAEFYSKWLIFDDKQDRLVSSPTYSPEHGPVSVGNTYEQSLIEQFYKDFIKASEILETDSRLRERTAGQLPLLKPFSVGKRGQLKEWFEEEQENFDRSEVQEKHRHISHLLALYPGKSINRGTPELLNAAVVTLNERGDESTGWARAYKLNLWARTGDGERAYTILRGLLTECTFPNLFDFHPPFQLDGNFGASAGIAEMLLQSHEGYIEPLAAIPDEWSYGEFRGLCARGGFEVSVKWRNKAAERIEVISRAGALCKIKAAAKSVTSGGAPVPFAQNGGLAEFPTVEGGVYLIEV